MEALAFDDALDEDDAPVHQGDDDAGRAPAGGQGGDSDEATAGGTDDLTEEPDAEAVDALFLAAVPDW